MKITIRKPDDFHVHLRDPEYLNFTLPDVVKRYRRALVMPNLTQPLTTIELVRGYRNRINAFCLDKFLNDNNQVGFTPLMTLYLTDHTDVCDIVEAKKDGSFIACKLYPVGATTNSDEGVSAIENIYDVLAKMEEVGMVLSVHGEDTKVDIFDREKIFIDKVLVPIHYKFSKLKIVMEHVTTTYACNTVSAMPDNIKATITAHHLYLTRNDVVNNIFNFCYPIAKREGDKIELRKMLTNENFFLGTDSAPHPIDIKIDNGAGGVYTAHNSLELYAQVFEEEDILDHFEFFASVRGSKFYDLPLNKEKITLLREPNKVPDSISYGHNSVRNFKAGSYINWRICNETDT